MPRFRSVLFDWRGTLVVNLTIDEWFRAALRSVERATTDDQLAALTKRLDYAELDGPGVDCDAALHRQVYADAFAAAGFDDELAEALYAVESDPRHNRFVSDAATTLTRLRRAGIRLGIVSDIHVDIRPAFAAVGLSDAIDTFALSFELGVQKPDRRIFEYALHALGVAPEESLMVGDRSAPDGGAVAFGTTTLLLPPLRCVEDRRLDLVERLVLDGAS